jgi:potassium efflux system protein
LVIFIGVPRSQMQLCHTFSRQRETNDFRGRGVGLTASDMVAARRETGVAYRTSLADTRGTEVCPNLMRLSLSALGLINRKIMSALRSAILVVALVALSWASVCPSPSVAQATNPPASATSAPPATPAAPDEKLPAVPVPQFPIAQARLDSWKQSLEQVEATLRIRALADTTLSGLRDQAAAAQSGAREMIASVTPPLEAATTRAAQLAPDPKATAPQSDDVKLERAKLLAEITASQSLIQQANLTNVRAQQLLDRISDRRRTLFADSVLQRSPSLINPTFWVAVAAAVPHAFSRLITLLSDWVSVLASQPLRTASGFVIAAAVLLGFLLSPGQRWQSRWTRRNPEFANPSALRKSGAAFTIVVAGTAIPGIALLVLYEAALALNVLPDNVAPIVQALFAGVTFAIFFAKLATAVFAPGRPSWRLVAVDDAVADGVIPLANLLAIVIAFGVVLDAVNSAIDAPVELIAASQGLVAVAKAILFMAALRVAAGDDEDDEVTVPGSGAKRSAWRLLIPVGWAAGVAALLGPLGGYVAFGRFLSAEMVVVAAVLMSTVLLSQFLSALIDATFAFHGWIGRFLRQTASLGSTAVRQFAVLLDGVVQLSLIVLAVFTILMTWGIRSDDVIGSISSAFFGFTVGGFTVSPSVILGAILVFVIGIVATRTIQRWLERRFLPETHLDVGVRSSIRTGAGYVGVILAVIVALSYVGLNLQNVAIVAGALSVGIGFGLQSIINNFVSGLILLVERPIKVGDRIEVGTRMGVVKRINVRATEIVTYDNLSVIVPNAELITGEVVNWMHGSLSARLSVMIGVSYDADPDKVIAILLDVVARNKRALKSPEPFAILGNFGANALEFSVFFHVANIGVDAGASNEVRLEILKRFRADGIEMPFPQRDIHLHDLDRIEALVRKIVGPNDAIPAVNDATDPNRKG